MFFWQPHLRQQETHAIHLLVDTMHNAIMVYAPVCLNSKAIHLLVVDQNVSWIKNALKTGPALGASVQILALVHVALKQLVLLWTIYLHVPAQKDILEIHLSVVTQYHVR